MVLGQEFRYPNAASVTVDAVGANGAPIPSQSILIGGENPSHNLKPLQVDAGGALIVSPLTSSSVVTANQGTANTASNRWPVYLTDGTTNNVFTANGLKVDVAASVLPTGAATAALQTSGNASLTSIATNTSTANGILGDILTDVDVLPTVSSSNGGAAATGLLAIGAYDGSAMRFLNCDSAGKLNVNAAVASLPLPSGAATAANQTNASQKTQIVDGSANVISSTGNALDVNLKTSSITLNVSAAQSGTWNITNISGTISLPTGASTSALQTTGNSSLASIVTNTANIPAKGQATMANSTPVAIASDQSTIKASAATPAAGTVTQAAITIGTSATRLTVSGSAPSATRSVLVFTPDSSSTATFYIGASSVTNSGANRGIQIVAGQTFIANNDAGDYYVIASVAAQTGYVMEQA